jgi:PAS domain-containing protein
MAWDFHPEEDVEYVATAYRGVLETGKPAFTDVGVPRSTGEVVPCMLSGSTLKDNYGEMVGLCCVGRDLTAVKRAETLYDVLTHSAMKGFTVSTLDGTILEMNDSYREILGYGDAEPGPDNMADVEIEASALKILDQGIEFVLHGYPLQPPRRMRGG